LEPTEKVDPSVARANAVNHVSLLFTWNDRAFAVALRENQACVVGRAESAEIVIDDLSLSRAHAQVSLNDGQVVVEDLGSTNGCLLNGVPITCATIQDHDSVQLGAIELRVCARTGSSDEAAPTSHAAFTRALVGEIARARFTGRCVSVLALKHDGGQKDRARLQSALKLLDRWCSFAPTIELVLLPEQDGAAARQWLRSALQPGGLELCAGVASYPALPGTAEQLVSLALEACRTATPGGIEEARSAGGTNVPTPPPSSPGMLRLYDLVARAARTTLPILVYGETGSGKELVARALHEKSLRCRGAFKAVNCATIPVGLVESVLFGHERGSFTGADRQASGIFEQASGGTVFLDEVGELCPQAQAALLRVLEQQRVLRLGATREVAIDVRVVAATHRNLSAMVRSGGFREDLLFRLDALTLRVPPLRERQEEIIPLAELFMTQAQKRWGGSVARLSEDAREALLAYGWPGNVRQLRNVIERAVVVCASDAIELEDLSSDVWSDPGEVSLTSTVVGERSPPTAASGDFRSLPDRVRGFEIALLQEALEKANGNQAHAARILGVPRRTLATKVHAYGLRPARA
jgi:DNA-binding NtrC family response regulator